MYFIFTDPQLMMSHLMSVYVLWVGMMMPKGIVTGRMLFFQQQGEGVRNLLTIFNAHILYII